MALKFVVTRRRVALLPILAVAAVVGPWAAAPLFIETRAEQPTPTGFTLSVKQGTWRGVDSFHFAEGTATILRNEMGELLLRLEKFPVRNGPGHPFLPLGGCGGWAWGHRPRALPRHDGQLQCSDPGERGHQQRKLCTRALRSCELPVRERPTFVT